MSTKFPRISKMIEEISWCQPDDKKIADLYEMIYLQDILRDLSFHQNRRDILMAFEDDFKEQREKEKEELEK